MSKYPTTAMNRPQHSTSFVAVESQPSQRPVEITVKGQDVSAPVHPEVFIQAYPSAKIKSIDVNGDNTRVTFDASTIATRNGGTLSRDITVNTVTGGVCAEFAQWAKTQDIACFFGYEHRRKARNSNTGELIPFTTPIFELMGHTEDNPKATMEATRANLSKVLAVIGKADDADANYVSDEARCHPSEWETFAHNHDGKATPAGWVRPVVDGKPAGCLIPAESAPAPDTTAELGEIKSMMQDLLRGPSYSSARGEAKPWMLKDAQGAVNPGSYAIGAVACTQRQAMSIINAVTAEQELSAEQRQQQTSTLTRVLLWAVDRVQRNVTGYTDRIANSHKHASQQVDAVIRLEMPYRLEFLDDKTEGKKWANAVVQRATALFAEAVELTGEAEGITGGRENAEDNQKSDDQQTPQPETASNAQVVADVEELGERWDALIYAVKMGNHITHLNPYLEQLFGTFLTTEIPADKFAAKLTEWEADNAAFINDAKAAYQAANQQAA